MALSWLALLLALPAAHGRDEPKKKDDKPRTVAHAMYDKLEKEHLQKQKQLIDKIITAKGAEWNTLQDQEEQLGRDYAEKFLKLAEDNPTDPIAVKAVFWCLYDNNVRDFPKAEPLAVALFAKMPLAELTDKLPYHGSSRSALLAAVLKRAESLGDDPATADLFGWVAASRHLCRSKDTPEAIGTATDRLVAHHPNHPTMTRLVGYLWYGSSPAQGAVLKRIADATTDPKLKAKATHGLGRNLVGQADAVNQDPEPFKKLAGKAETALARVAELLGAAGLKTEKGEAEDDLKAFTALRIGTEAPDIAGADLNGKGFKLTDYRGKVVLLDFWGHW